MTTQSQSKAPWIYNPALDLIVGCGAWSAPLLLVTYFAGSGARGWAITFYGLALLFNYPHYMATIYRAYHTREDFQKYRIFTVHITALIVLTLILSHFWARALPWIFTAYLTWSPWHYSGQNYGLFMMFARRAGAKPEENDRQALYGAFLLSYLVLVLGFHTGVSNDPLFVSLGIPAKASTAIIAVLGVGFLGFSYYGLTRLARQIGWREMLPPLTLFSTQFLWFLLPTVLSFTKGLQIPQSRYSTGVLAVMHSAQYLWITSYYARREAGTSESPEQGSRWRPLAYFGVLVAGGIALFVPGPWIASRMFHFDFTSSFLIFTALVNIHHFILDGAIWKLRDGRIAALLLGSPQRVSRATADAGNWLLDGLRWLAGSSSRAHAVRVTAAVLLVGWASVDQARYYFALHDENLAYLQRAAELDSFDSRVQTRLGRKELEAGNLESAVAAWRQAVRTNPADAAARDGLLRYLTANQRFDEAYELTRTSLTYSPRDPSLLLNHGILANQAGHHDEALSVWKKALAIAPSEFSAHLYLAEELNREEKTDAAIPHYMSYLKLATASSVEQRPPASEVITVLLRLAQCQQKVGRTQQAQESAALAQKIASQTGQARLEAFAAVSGGNLAASQGKTGKALFLYQHALQLDAMQSDRRGEAADWYAYGLFLRDTGHASRLVYACLLKAETLMQPFQDAPEFKTMVAARQEAEKKLAAQAAEVRRNPAPWVREALALTAR